MINRELQPTLAKLVERLQRKLSNISRLSTDLSMRWWLCSAFSGDPSIELTLEKKYRRCFFVVVGNILLHRDFVGDTRASFIR